MQRKAVFYVARLGGADAVATVISRHRSLKQALKACARFERANGETGFIFCHPMYKMVDGKLHENDRLRTSDWCESTCLGCGGRYSFIKGYDPGFCLCTECYRDIRRKLLRTYLRHCFVERGRNAR